MVPCLERLTPLRSLERDGGLVGTSRSLPVGLATLSFGNQKFRTLAGLEIELFEGERPREINFPNICNGAFA